MKKYACLPVMIVSALIMISCVQNLYAQEKTADEKMMKDTLPAPFATKSTKNFSKVIGWGDQMPVAPEGFTISKFADSLQHPRWIYVAENGDVFIAESNTILKGILKFGAKISRKIKTQHIGESANRITMFRDSNKDGIVDQRFVFAENLNQPFGRLILGNHFYVGNTDALVRFDYKLGDTKLNSVGTKIVSLPAGKHNRHWARNIITNRAGDKIYIAVGSGTNVAEEGLENEIRRACILEVNVDGSCERIYASGLRNAAGMAWAPGTNTLWTAVNERDELGDELVPDYFTSVKEGGFYGWPFSYFGQHEDPRMKDHQRPDLVSKAIVPDVPLGSHTASLGLVFYTHQTFPAKYHNGAFIAQHGSWNRKELAGYKVIFIPFASGKPSGPQEDFLTGFAVEGSTDSEVRGRPVDVALLADGSMLVTDDVSNTVWKVSKRK
jgi:glucose/arabinose dehydrogenase